METDFIMRHSDLAINATNLHKGGGVQVAASFIYELAKDVKVASDFDVFVSSKVSQNLDSLGVDYSVFRDYIIWDVYGVDQIFNRINKRFRSYDVVFTIFGPLYMFFRPFFSVVGFAQPWIAYPDNEIYRDLGLIAKLKTRLKFLMQEFFFRGVDRLIVELPHVKDRLLERGFSKEIDVVSNCISDVFKRPELWKEIDFPTSQNLKIGIVSRDYPHKNLKVLPRVRNLLRFRYGLSVDFFVTLTQGEWSKQSDEFKRCIFNVGEISVAQCPSFYKSLDAVIFPSFLECFSATPIEAIYMGLPLFASDRNFVRDVCGDMAIYFEPSDPESIARKIYNFFSENDCDICLNSDVDIARFDAGVRAKSYIKILRSISI